VLKLPTFALSSIGLALALGAPPVRAQDDADDALRRPARITVGINDQFLGQLGPDGKKLFFVSNRETRKEVFAQDIEEGRAKIVFDEGSDVTWPRVSPDGKSLLYVSFRDQATGELCIRELPDGSNRRCLDDSPAALQAEWIDDKRIALVGRTSIEGDLGVSEVSVADRLSKRILFEKNWTSPAISPDGRWLVYVPLDRVTKHVGPGFAARVAGRLEAVRLDGRAEPRPVVIDLPGLTGQPAFGRDGRSLYFVQFLSDSNHDDVIDAGDHGVLFRIPFPAGVEDASSVAPAPLQLTDSASNCQYPAPAAKLLVATCSHGQTLDIYELPLDGEVPNDWTNERLRAEADLSNRRADTLLLYRHLLAREKSLTERRLLTMRLFMNHLELEEFQAAEFYAEKVRILRDPATRGIAQPLLALVEQRRARSAAERGRTIDTFADEARARMDRLKDGAKDTPVARVLNHVVRSEIQDSLGDKSAARAELDLAVVDESTPAVAIELYFARADALYRELDLRDELVSVCRRLARLESLAASERLDYARAAARAMVRGLPLDEADAALARARDAEPGDTDYGFALDLARAVRAIKDEGPAREVRARLTALYDAQKRTDRKRAIILDAVQRAADAGADSLIEVLSSRYVDDVAPGTNERRRADRLYRRAILGRAYRRLAKGRLAEARADFEAVFRRTGALDAAVGAVDLRLRQGERPDAIGAELERGAEGGVPMRSFLRAYLLACKLPELSGEQHARAVADARALLRASWGALKDKGPVRALYGSIMHQAYLRTGAPAAAETANSHYMVALELSARDPRQRAMVLGQLGLLHTEVGNYRIALGYLEERARLPYNGGIEELAVRLATAKALLHLDKEGDSAKMADSALALVDRVPALASHRVLALDRAALANLAAGRFKRALELYDREVPLLSEQRGPGAYRNWFVVRLARAASAVGAGQPRRALEDLAAVEPRFGDAQVVAALAFKYGTPEDALRSYRSIAAGLRANANRAMGELESAAVALANRRALFVERLTHSDRDEDVRALTLVELRLAENATARRDLPAAAKWLGFALDHADSLVLRTHAAFDVDQLRALWFGAQIDALDHAPVTFDAPKRLAEAQKKLIASRDSAYRAYERWFEIYLAMTEKGRTASPGSARK
jgi:hypothetical protein